MQVRVSKGADYRYIHARGLPPCHGINVSPSGRLPSILTRPTGSLVTGTPVAVIARAVTSLVA